MAATDKRETSTSSHSHPNTAPASSVSLQYQKLAEDSAVNVSALPSLLRELALAGNAPIPEGTKPCRGIDFDAGRDIDNLIKGWRYTGFQSTNLVKGIDEINKMIHWRMSPEEAKRPENEHLTPEEVEAARCTIFLGFTSNQISSGNREVIKYLCQHNMIDCIVTTAGAIEEDVMKLFTPHWMGAFDLRGADLRLKGHNRTGNLIVPNINYTRFEDWLTPIYKACLKEQREDGVIWTPSKMIRRMGKEIAKEPNCEESCWYWCYKNNIPVFCPALTDGAVGDLIYFQSYADEMEFILDIAQDIRLLNDVALSAVCSGMVILGGGVIKHHICNANLMRNGAEFSLYVNTAQEFDGSDAGARPDEAVSWGKIRLTATPVKVYGEATVFFPLIVAGSFAHPDHNEAAKKPKRKLQERYNIPQLA